MPIKASERRKVYRERRENGLCPRCGAKISKRDKHIYCEDCRSFYREYNREISDSVNKKRRTQYKLRKTNNQCPRCGKTLGKKYTNTLCVKCLGKNIPKSDKEKKSPPKTKVLKNTKK